MAGRPGHPASPAPLPACRVAGVRGAERSGARGEAGSARDSSRRRIVGVVAEDVHDARAGWQAGARLDGEALDTMRLAG
jgi:hypothetical protein